MIDDVNRPDFAAAGPKRDDAERAVRLRDFPREAERDSKPVGDGGAIDAVVPDDDDGLAGEFPAEAFHRGNDAAGKLRVVFAADIALPGTVLVKRLRFGRPFGANLVPAKPFPDADVDFADGVDD